MVLLSGQNHQGDSHETLTDERPEELSSSPAGWHESISAGPPFCEVDCCGRRWLPRLLVWAAILISWDQASTQLSRFAGARKTLTSMLPSRRVVGRSYQGFIKALLPLQQRLLELVCSHLRGQIKRLAGRHWSREGIVAFAIDGSRIECPRTKINEQAFGLGGKKGCGPQMWLTTLWHMGTGLPWAFMQGRSDSSERHHLREMLPLLPQQSMIVGDAGFVGFQLLGEIISSGRLFLVRAGGNVRLLRQLGWIKCEGGETVYLWPRKHRDCPPLVLRLIVLQRRGRNIHLLTNAPEESLNLRQASVLYGMRWGVEVFYRSLKQTLEHRMMRSRSPKQAQAELAWSVVGLQLMGLMSVQEIIADGNDPLGWSLAATRDLIRQAMRFGPSRALSDRSWRRALAACVKDGYCRRGEKDSRQWPDRKHQQPPEPPKTTVASAKEIQQAQELQAKHVAA